MNIFYSTFCILCLGALSACTTTSPVISYQETHQSQWQCGSQTIWLQERNSVGTFWLEGRSFDVPQLISASGVHYANTYMDFWSKGQQARFKQKNTNDVMCQQTQTLQWKGFGNEPSWSVQAIERENNALLNIRINDQSYTAPTLLSKTGIYEGIINRQPFKLSVIQLVCTDNMSGWRYPKSMELTYLGKTYKGCAGERIID